MKSNYKRLAPYIRQVDERNTEDKHYELLGVSVDKCFIKSIANTVGTDWRGYKKIRRGQFCYIPDTSRRGDKIGIALQCNYEIALVSQAYTVFEIIDTNSLLPGYLNLWFKRPEFDRYARFHSHGSVREIFDWEEMCNVELPIPSLAEQQKIVDAYNIIERRIELKRKINDNLEAQMSSLFNEKFIPLSFDCDGEQILSDIMSFDNGYAFSSDDYLSEGQYKIITIGNVNDGYIDTNHVNYVDSISEKVKKCALLQVEDLIISLTGNVGRTAIVKEKNLLLNQRVARIVPKDNRYKWFFYCLFRQLTTKNFLETISRGTAQANLSPIELLKTKICYDIDEIIKFSTAISPIIKLILANSNEITSLLKLHNAFLTTLSR